MGRIRKVFDVVVHNTENDQPSKNPLTKSPFKESELVKTEEIQPNVLCVSIPRVEEEIQNSRGNALNKIFEIPDLISPFISFEELPVVDFSELDFFGSDKDKSIQKCAKKCRELILAFKDESKINSIKLAPKSEGGKKCSSLTYVKDNEKFSVFVRIFPSKSENETFLFHNESQITIQTNGIKKREFSFKRVFSSKSTNEDIYNNTVSMMRGPFLTGESATCFTFGQTCSGKTYTLFEMENCPGICFQFAAHVLSSLDSLNVSVYEIYYEKINDLLPENSKNPLLMCSDEESNIKVLNLTVLGVTTIEDLVKLISDCLSRRVVDSSDSFGHSSSRSHMVVRFENPHYNNEFYFIDLAGSERARVNSDPTWSIDAGNINSTLLALKECIRGYSKNRPHVPFRRSKLTRLLNHVFGEHRIFAVCTVREDEAEQSLNTLEYAERLSGLTGRSFSDPFVAEKSVEKVWRRKIGRREENMNGCSAFSKQYVHKLIKSARNLN